MTRVEITLNFDDLTEAAKEKALFMGLDPFYKSNGKYELAYPNFDIDDVVTVSFSVEETD